MSVLPKLKVYNAIEPDESLRKTLTRRLETWGRNIQVIEVKVNMIFGLFSKFWHDSQLGKIWFTEAKPETFQLPLVTMILLTYFRGDRVDNIGICFSRNALFLVFINFLEKKDQIIG